MNLLGLLGVVGTTLRALITGPFHRAEGTTLKKHVAATFLRAISQYVVENGPLARLPDTTAVYRKFAKSKDFEPVITPFEGDCSGLWIGSPQTRKVVLYFHGGAYINPAAPAQLEIVRKLVTKAAAQGTELAVCVLAYHLGEQSQYPKQIEQARNALEYLLTTAERRPVDIFLGGDSAGGNLVAALLLHLSHPHPEVKPLDLNGGIIKGAYLVSPWISFDYATPSIEANKTIDFLTVDTLRYAENIWLGNKNHDVYNAPLMADASQWEGVKCSSILVTGGLYEILADQIAAFGRKLQVHNPGTEVFMVRHEIHVQCAMDTHLGYPTAQSELCLQQWLLKLL